MIEKIDLRFKKSQDFINDNIGEPVYKRRAFSYIDKILGPQYKWIDKSPEEYFYEEGLSQEKQEIQELQRSANILRFTSGTSFQDIKKTYKELSRGFRSSDSNNNDIVCAWHPDLGGHPSAFAILNHAYNNFKEIYYNDNSV